jgi:hypothetical protein
MRRLLFGAALTAGMSILGNAGASSHREAPFITKNPKVDGTDFYMFQSYEADRLKVDGTSDYTTIIANYIPLQDAYGGPNYFSFDPEALYEIHVENTGDAVEDITFQFQFKNALNPVSGKGIALDIGGKTSSIPTIQANVAIKDNNGPPLTKDNAYGAYNGTNGLLNVQETYTINVVKGARRGAAGTPVKHATTNATTFAKPVDNIGSRTFGGAAAYKTYADAHVHPITIPDCDTPGKVFVGQRQEGFRVNLGLIFDLVNAPLGTITNPANRNAFTGNTTKDNTLNKNVSSIALEIPTKCLTSDRLPGNTTTRPKIGGWTTASVRQARVINPEATYDKPSKEGGAWAQVSRLGMPLTNEVVIGIADKDRFNSSEPKNDTQFIDYVTNPTLPQVLQLIFGGASTPGVFPAATTVREDLVTIFLKGVPGVNDTGSVGEMLRLNTALPTKGVAAQTGGNWAKPNAFAGLGAAGCFPHYPGGPSGAAGGCTKANIAACFEVAAGAACDTGGFPNGRRPGDDVVDIELTVLLGYFIPKGTGAGQAPNGGTVLHDGVLNEEAQFDGKFPYLKTPYSGDL